MAFLFDENNSDADPFDSLAADKPLNAELVFGVSVTFDHGPDSYPKVNLYIPVAMRFNQSEIEYARFNTENDCAEQEWTPDSEEFCKRLIKQYADYFDHDPHSGFGRKTQIGFM